MPVVPGVPGAALPPGDDAIIRRIQELERAQKELLPAIMAIVGPQIATLTSQQATLAAQQATLTTAVANISTLVGQQVAVDVKSASAGTLTLSTTLTDYAIASLTVPSGYSQALVLGISTLVTGATTSVEVANRINGVDGSYVLGLQTSGAWNLTAPSTRVVTGLSGGTIPVASRAHVVSGSGPSTVLITAAAALFLR